MIVVSNRTVVRNFCSKVKKLYICVAAGMILTRYGGLRTALRVQTKGHSNRNEQPDLLCDI